MPAPGRTALEALRVPSAVALGTALAAACFYPGSVVTDRERVQVARAQRKSDSILFEPWSYLLVTLLVSIYAWRAPPRTNANRRELRGEDPADLAGRGDLAAPG